MSAISGSPWIRVRIESIRKPHSLGIFTAGITDHPRRNAPRYISRVNKIMSMRSRKDRGNPLDGKTEYRSRIDDCSANEIFQTSLRPVSASCAACASQQNCYASSSALFAQYDLFRNSCSEGDCLYHSHSVNSKPADPMQLKQRGNFSLPPNAPIHLAHCLTICLITFHHVLHVFLYVPRFNMFL